MDALLAAGREAAGGRMVRVVLVPTAVARHRPELAAAHGERAFRAAAARAGVEVDVLVAWVVDRASAAHPPSVQMLERAHVIHLPGGDPDLPPTVLRDTSSWTAIVRANAAGACLAGASAGAMALGSRLWTPKGPMDGLDLVPDTAVLPHYDAARLASWRRAVEWRRPLTWIGLDEQTLVIGRPGEPWTVAGRGRAHVLAPGRNAVAASAGPGSTVTIG